MSIPAKLHEHIEAVCQKHGWVGKTAHDSQGRWFRMTGFAQPAWADGIAFMYDPHGETLSVYVGYTDRIAKKSRVQVGELVNRINYGLSSGVIEFDLDNGDLRVRTSMFVGAQKPNRALIDQVATSALEFAAQYFDVVREVASGAVPKRALSRARKAS